MEEFEMSLAGSGDTEAPDLGASLSQALLAWDEILESVRALATGERRKLVDDGWDDENAQLMAMSVYGTFLNQLLGISQG